MAPKRKRVAADITEIEQELRNYPEVSQEIEPEAWEMLTDAQKLIYLAKMRLKDVKRSKKDD